MSSYKRKTETTEFDDGEVVCTSEQLSYEAAEDLLPEVMGIIANAAGAVAPLLSSGDINLSGDTSDIAKLAPILPALASQIGGGKLKRLVGPICAGTSVVMPDPGAPTEKIQLSLVKKEDRAILFEARPHLYFQIIFFAGRVTFGRFFPGSVRREKTPAVTATASS